MFSSPGIRNSAGVSSPERQSSTAGGLHSAALSKKHRQHKHEPAVTQGHQLEIPTRVLDPQPPSSTAREAAVAVYLARMWYSSHHVSQFVPYCTARNLNRIPALGSLRCSRPEPILASGVRAGYRRIGLRQQRQSSRESSRELSDVQLVSMWHWLCLFCHCLSPLWAACGCCGSGSEVSLPGEGFGTKGNRICLRRRGASLRVYVVGIFS